ncbi:uncharacterized protein LOC110050020 [Orbicella faveolata]|uniref:uncharacterized protein LOC110050020 n=1 Tax=Orbicella faveolata TaxID=48498 RepID=UPI0009E32921|nr:uncharacterized protein LOC110050020 [Orbicella faveolata]
MKELSLPTIITSMKTRSVKMHLSMAFLMVFALRIGNSCQNINSDEDHDGKYTMHVSDVYQTAVERDYESENPKVCGADVKCHTNEMSISLPKSLLVSIDRENLQLLDPTCTATENSTHFVLTTTLIGCGTSSSQTENSLVYSNRVRHVPPGTAVITRAPEVQISFSCHYSKYGFVSTGALRSEKRTNINRAAERVFDEDICWNNRCGVLARF